MKTEKLFKILKDPLHSREFRMTKLKNFLLFSCSIACVTVGCKRPDREVAFEPNRVFAKAMETKLGEYGKYMPMALEESSVAINEMFGTPDEPKLPDFLEGEQKEFLDAKKLELASGPIEAGRGLYRKHCIACHGVTGNGRGPNALQADVYPRDFRVGKYKFKSTPRGYKPTKEDLYISIRNGIAGTPMVAIQELSDDDVHALVDYVIYLSWRGETERAMLMASEEVEFENDAHLYLVGSSGFEDQQSMVKDSLSQIADAWISAEESVKSVPEPGEIPVNATVEELIAAASSPEDSPLKRSIELGKALFLEERSSCFKCHGPTGQGDGPQKDYDEWTKDWTVNMGIDVNNADALVPLQAMGALPPKFIVPRNFSKGIYRGGSSPEKIYSRIAQGIEGTPMPAGESVLKPEEIWHLVNFVRSMEEPKKPGEIR